MNINSICGMLASFILMLSACESQNAFDRRFEIGETVTWMEEDLDNAIISRLSEIDLLKGYRTINGRIVGVYDLLAEDASRRFDGACGATFLQNHYLFYNETEVLISLIVIPRSTPDDDNQYRELVDESGQRKLAITLLPGARELKGCRLEYRFDKATNTLTFVREVR